MMQSIKNLGLFQKAGIKDLGKRTCKNCGNKVPIYEVNGKRASICIKCEDISIAQRVKEQIAKEDENLLKRLIEKYETIPFEERTTFRMYEPTTDIQEKAKETALAFAKEELKNINTLFFQGEPGIGKTHLSHSVAEVFRYFDKSVLFIDMPSLLSKIRDSYSPGSIYSQNELMWLIEKVELLILDDIGAEYVRSDDGNESWVTDILYQIVNVRKGKYTVYSTNYQVQGLIEKYGSLAKRIISRMLENTQIIRLDGEDYRLKSARREL